MGKRAKRVVAGTAYTVISYIICTYAVFATIVNVLNMVKIRFIPGLMKPTFWGSSLLILLLLLYELIHATRKNEVIKKIRPYIMGLLIADIVSAGRFPLCLILLLVLGYFLTSGFHKRYDAQEAALTAVTASIGIEIYSIIYLLLENVSSNIVHSFLQSVGPDVLFILSAIAYGTVTNTPSEKIDAEPDAVSESEETANKKRAPKLKAAREWFSANSTKIVQSAGYGLCIISAALFFYYALAVGISTKKVAASAESLYVLEHCEDTTLALTAVETEDPTVYKVSFEKYEGKDNQKIYFQEISENKCHVFFSEPVCALEIGEDGGLYATSGDTSSPQEWINQVYEDELTVVRLFATPETPLRYNLLDNSNTQFFVSADSDGTESEFFIMERTIGDRFATRMATDYYAEFAPTMLMETIFALLGTWTWLFFIISALVVFSIIYSRRFIGDKLAVLAAMLLLYVLAYESVYTIALFYAAFGIRWHYCFRAHNLRRKRSEGER